MSPRRILVVRVGAMGDVLHALPAAAALRRAWPDVQLDWVVDPRWAPLLVDERGQGPVVSGLHLADTKLWSRAPLALSTARSVLGLRDAVSTRSYDFVVDLQGTLRSAVIGRMADGKEYLGSSDPREAIARRFYRRALPRHGAHVVEQYAGLLGDAVGLPLLPGETPLPRSEEAEAWYARRFGEGSPRHPLALLAPSAGWGAKRWPAERFAELADVLALSGFDVLINAASDTDPVAGEVLRCSVGPARRVTCDLSQLIALTRRAAVVMCGDSGPLHLAAALARPVVALFGPTDPARNGPWGPGPKAVLRDPLSAMSHKRVDTPDPGLQRVSVDEVLAAVHRIAAPNV